MKKINHTILNQIVHHNQSLSIKSKLKGMSYERCAELPFIIERLKPLFNQKLEYLDIGSGGESPLPSYFLKNTNWNITIVDKYKWVRNQLKFAKNSLPDYTNDRFKIIEKDFILTELDSYKYDIITNISVIEHFEGDTDKTAMEASGKLLKKDGIYFLTTPMNESYYKEIYVNNDVYGDKAVNKKVFYQRHYDTNSVKERIITPSNLKEVQRIYFGDYNMQFFEEKWNCPKYLKPFKIFFAWRIHNKAYKYLSYSEYPISKENMKNNTASGVILEMTK